MNEELKCAVDVHHKVIMVEYHGMHPYHYDGVSEIKCLDCGRRAGRWCGNMLTGNEVEPRYCEGGEHPTVV